MMMGRKCQLAMQALFLQIATQPAGVMADSAAVTVLQDATWEGAIGAHDGPWMVEFYAPWCAHCKKLAPIWDEVAETFAKTSNVKFAKADATSATALAKKFGVKSYPVIKFFEAGYTETGATRDFKSSRDEEGLTKFVHKVTGPVVLPVSDVDEFTAFDDIVFLLCDDEASPTFQEDYGKVALEFLDSIYFGKADSDTQDALGKTPERPAVAALDKRQEKGSKHYAEWHTTSSKHSLKEFVEAHRFAPMVQLTRKNFFATANAGKLTLLAIVDPAGTRQEGMVNMLESVVRNNMYSLNSGWLDGLEWEKYVVEQYETTPEEIQAGAIRIYDGKEKTFYTPEGPMDTPAAVQAFIDDVVGGKLASKNTERGVMAMLKQTFLPPFMGFVEFLEDNPMAMVLMCLPMLGMVAMIATSVGPRDPTKKE